MNNRKRMIQKAKLMWHKRHHKELLKWNNDLLSQCWRIVYSMGEVAE